MKFKVSYKTVYDYWASNIYKSIIVDADDEFDAEFKAQEQLGFCDKHKSMKKQIYSIYARKDKKCV